MRRLDVRLGAGERAARLAAAMVAGLSWASGAQAYNHDQHHGVVALAYKAMVAAGLERGCPLPIAFPNGDPQSVRTFPSAYCDGDENLCRARWTQMLGEIEQAIVFLRGVPSSLGPPPVQSPPCADPRSGGNTLGEVRLAVDRYYDRAGGAEHDFCGIPADTTPGCSMPVGLCDGQAIYRFLAPDDHTGDVLGYWATLPDDDHEASTLGVKLTNAGGSTLDDANDTVETGLTALAVPIVCAFNFLTGRDSDCLDDARRLADGGFPLEELHGLMPVIGNFRDAESLAGLWHFQNLVPGVDNQCDDRQGMLYEQAGPRKVPDALDLAIVVLGDRFGVTLSYDRSTGPPRFNVTDPGDGDAPSCERGRGDWELESIGHTPFSPLDNLALWGWKRFAQTPRAEELGWPLHAIGDAVAPHHVVGTTGWGHRPFEDAAERYWRRILYLDSFLAGEQLALQYQQLARILGWGLYYTRVIDRLRLDRPVDEPADAVPVRAFVTEIAAGTLRETHDDLTGAPIYPFSPSLSVPYVVDQSVKTRFLTEVYGTESSIASMRALIERGAGATVAFLTYLWRVQAPSPPPSASPCDPTEGEGVGVFACGPSSFCGDVNFPNPPPYGCCFGNS